MNKKTKETIDIVFIVVTYRNAMDLRDFFESIKKCNLSEKSKVIVANSYYDDASMHEIEKITKTNDGIFLNRSNKGYGAGNNAGIKYAMEHLYFKLLVVSNPDIEVKRFNNKLFNITGAKIFAPQIIRNDGQNQNPMRATYGALAEWCIYTSFTHDLIIPFYMGILLNKLNKKWGGVLASKIYQPHGSFIIFTKAAVKKLCPIFDEKIFLFCEESDLAQRCRKEHIEILYDRSTIVRHHEDGSIRLSEIDLKGELKKSYIYYYKKWH